MGEGQAVAGDAGVGSLEGDWTMQRLRGKQDTKALGEEAVSFSSCPGAPICPS